MTGRPELRPATADDIREFYDGRHSMRAIVAEIDGRPVGLAGLVYLPGCVTVVSVVRPELRAFPWTILEGARIVAGWAREANALAIADPVHPKSARLLTQLGFAEIGETPEGKVFGWRKQFSR